MYVLMNAMKKNNEKTFFIIFFALMLCIHFFIIITYFIHFSNLLISAPFELVMNSIHTSFWYFIPEFGILIWTSLIVPNII